MRAQPSKSRRADSHGRHALLGLIIPIVITFATACSADHAVRSSMPSRSRPTSPRHGHPAASSTAGWLNSDEPSPTDRDLLGVITRFWSTYATASDRHDQSDTAAVRATFATVATGASLERLVTIAGRNAGAGLAVRGSVISHPRVVILATSTATVTDCYDDRTGLYDIGDGHRLDADDPRPHRATFHLVRARSGWKVATVDQSEEPCTD